MVQNLIVPYIGKRKVQELRTYDIEKFYAILAKTPCAQYVHGVKQDLSKKQKKRLLSSTSIHEVHTLLKTAFSYAVEWDLIHKIPLPREAPKANSEERTIWDEKTMLAALQTIENPALHLAVHLSMILSLREGEILGLQPSDLDFDTADGRGTISVSKTMQRANKDALEKLDPHQIYHTFPDRREGSKSSLILKKPKTKKSNRVLYMDKALKGRTAGMAGKAEAGRAESLGEVQQLRATVPAPGRLAHRPGTAHQVVPAVAVSAPGVRADRIPRSAALQCHLPALAVGWRLQVGAGQHRPCNCRRPHGHLRPHAGQAPVGADREDRSKLLLPRPDPGSIPALAKRKAGGNKNLR